MRRSPKRLLLAGIAVLAVAAAPAPAGDIDDLETELILADLEVVERRLERLEAQIEITLRSPALID